MKASFITFLFLFSIVVLTTSCTSSFKNQDPTNKKFPILKGENLEKTKVTIPKYFNGKFTILLIGYKQNSQFDIDRWILGLTDSGVKQRVYEIPAVVGMIPGMISGKINDGMRSGIPKELWVDVITLYGGDAKVLAEFTGTEYPLNSRVILIDPTGKVIFFHDRGYAISFLKKLVSLLPKNKSIKGN